MFKEVLFLYNKILVPVDGSDYSNNAVLYAAGLAEKLGAELTILHVLPPTPTYISNYSDRMESIEKTLMNEFTKEAQDILAKNKNILSKKNISIKTKLIIGNPADEISKLAAEKQYDLIVIGNRGLGGIKGYLMGSVSNRVSRHAKCPVLIYRQ